MAADPTEREARIDRLCGEYLTAAATGREPDRATWLAQHPDLADELAELLDCLNEVGRRVAPLRAVAGGDTIDHHSRDAVPTGAVSAPHGYEILEKIAEGGMGVVYRARAVELNRVVALKMIRAGDLAGAAVQRFRQEAKAAAGFDHPHIVPVYDVGVTDAGDPFFSMKLVEGRTLGDWIADGWAPGGPLRTTAGVRDGILLLAAVTRGVHYAHQRGFLHRDLKPANVLLDGAGVPYVTDFGLAKRLEDSSDDLSLTQLGGMVGTLGYMAPEQARGEKSLTTAADVYALGAILFQVLTGRPLRPGLTLAEVSSHLGKEPPRPRSLNCRADHDLEAICLKCLEDKPESRFGSAEALADELDRWSQGRPTRTRPAGSGRRLWMWARRRPDVAALLALTVLVFFAGVGLVGWKWRAELAARREVQAQASRSAAIVAQSLLEEGTDGDPENLGGAMLWWARSFQLAPAGSARERSAARVNLAALAGRLHTLREVWERPDPASHLVIASDGRRGAIADAEAVRILDAQTGGVSGPALAHAGVERLAFSPDGDWLATTGGGVVLVWNLLASPPVPTRTIPFAGELAAAIGPGGGLLAVAGPDSVRLLEEGQPVRELPGVGRVDALAFDHSGSRLATGGADKFARVWDAAKGTEVWKRLHDDAVRAVAFSPDGSKLVTGSDDHLARIWSLGRDAPPLKLEHQDYVWSVAFSPDGRLVASGGADSAAQVWEADTGRRVGQLLSHGGGVGAVGFTADGVELVTASTDGATRVWTLSRAARTDRAVSLETTAFAVVAIPESSGVYAGTARGVYRFDQTAPASGKQEVAVPPGGEVWAVACTAHPGWVAAAGRTADEKGWMRVWPSNGAGARDFPFDQPVRSLAFAPNGTRLLVATADATKGEAREWNPTTPGTTPAVLMKGRSVWAVAFSPDGTRHATSAGDGSVQVWDSAQSPRMVRELTHPWRVVALAFRQDGERLVTASTDRHVRVWSTATGDILSESSAHRGAVWAVAVSPDGRLVATAGRDRCVRVWDASAGTPVGAPLRHRDVVWAVTFGRGGRDIWSGSEDGTLRRWRVPDATLALPDEHLETWAEAVTGQRLDGDRVRVLGASEWRDRRDRMSGSW